MALSINWVTKEIFVPKADLLLIQSSPSEIRQLDLNTFRLELKDIEDDEGIPFDSTHNHNTAVTVGGVTLARVIEIINGYTVTFEDGQYAVNLVGANSNVGDVINVNQVSVRSANSAGLTFSEEINNQSFSNNRVYINTNGDSMPGTSFPRGTPTSPVDTFADALVIASARKFHDFDLDGLIILNPTDILDDTNWHGTSPIESIIVCTGNNVTKCTFTRCGMTGVVNGRASYDTCALQNIVGFSGIADNCGFNGNITIDPLNTQNILFKNCTSVIAGSVKPILDCSGSSGDIHIRNYTGELLIKNFSAGQDMAIDMLSGAIEIDSTCTAGIINISGTVDVIDNSGPGCTVILNSTTAELVNTGMNSNALLNDIHQHGLVLDYNGAISVDTTNGTSGTTHPVGTGSTPSNSITNALIIANNINIPVINISGTVNFADAVPGIKFIGSNILSSVLVFNGQNTSETSFENILVSGALNGKVLIRNSALGNIIGFNGYVQDSMLFGDLTVDNTILTNIIFNNCYSIVDNSAKPILNCNATTADIYLNKYTGDIKITNMSGSNEIHLDMISGRVEIDSSCVTGTVIIRGNVSELIDNSAAGCTVLDLSANSVLLNTNINNYQTVDSVGENILFARIQAALAAALSA